MIPCKIRIAEKNYFFDSNCLYDRSNPLIVGSPEELSEALTFLMDKITNGDKNRLSSDSIIVSLSGPDMPDLTLIDLPESYELLQKVKI